LIYMTSTYPNPNQNQTKTYAIPVLQDRIKTG
jgi:hypothetical protein